MKITHWSLCNGSGLHNVAVDISEAEVKLGHESKVLSSLDSKVWSEGVDADIHISHSHIPDPVRKESRGKWIWVGHGTPEHCFKITVETMTHTPYAPSDCMMLIQWWMQNAHAIVTFWPRHAEIWSSLCDRNTVVDCVPLGVNKDFWETGISAGKYAGNPSVFTAENCHDIKWPLDLMIMWPWICEELPDARFHLAYLPTNQHRVWLPWMNRNGAGFRSYISGITLSKENLRNAFKSIDYYASPVRYGDFNKICLEAKASGAKVISFAGNPYADFWIPEGDQRLQKEVMVKILKKEIEPRKTDEIIDIAETAKCMIGIYERVLNE